jgi:hypothetical protein
MFKHQMRKKRFGSRKKLGDSRAADELGTALPPIAIVAEQILRGFRLWAVDYKAGRRLSGPRTSR